jgi:hypothetical protein
VCVAHRAWRLREERAAVILVYGNACATAAYVGATTVDFG